jgi:hypothetical protein
MRGVEGEKQATCGPLEEGSCSIHRASPFHPLFSRVLLTPACGLFLSESPCLYPADGAVVECTQLAAVIRFAHFNNRGSLVLTHW